MSHPLALPVRQLRTLLLALLIAGAGCAGEEESSNEAGDASSQADGSTTQSGEGGGLASLFESLQGQQQSTVNPAPQPGTEVDSGVPGATNAQTTIPSPNLTTNQPAPGEIAATTPEVEEEEYDPHLDPATWLDFAEDVPIYPGTERGSGWSFEDGPEFHNDGGWSTTDSFDEVFDWYTKALPNSGWTNLTGGIGDQSGIGRFEGWKGNRQLMVSVSLTFFPGDDGEKDVLIHIKEIVHPR